MYAFVNQKINCVYFPYGEQGLPGAAGQDGPPGPMVSMVFSVTSKGKAPEAKLFTG